MPKVPVVQLQEFCEVLQGGRLRLTGNDFVADGFPAYGAGGINGQVAVAEFSRPAVLLSSIGARCGKCFYADGHWTSLANTQVILPDLEKADCRYLWFQLNDETRWPRSGTAQPFIKPSDVKAHRVLLPPMAEQRRIAERLDRVEGVRAKRRATLAMLDALTQSIFVNMFGDPGSNPRNIPLVAMRDLFRIARGGSPRPIAAFLTDSVDGINWITIGDTREGGKYITDARRRIRPDGATRSRLVRPGDLLLTNSMSFGRPYLLQIPGCIHDGWLVLSPKDPSLNPHYFHHLLGTKPIQDEFARLAPGSTVKNLNIDLVAGVRLPVADAAEQDLFGRRVAAVESVADRMTQSLRSLDGLLASLMHSAFNPQVGSPGTELEFAL